MMSTKKFLIALLIVMGFSLSFFSRCESEELKLVPKKRVVSDVQVVAGTEVGTGWSTKENPEEAVKQAVEMALEGKKHKIPDFAILFASSGSDMKSILFTAKKMFQNRTKIYGGTSDSRAVITNKGYAKATQRAYQYAKMEGKRSLAIMTITSKDILFGVGSAGFSDYPSVQKASEVAISNAIKNAGKSLDDLPRAVLVTPTHGVEEEVIEGIEKVVGQNTPVLGGTTGGPTFAVFGENKVYEKGVSLAVIYTNFTMGWIFEGGFDLKVPSTGIVTKVDGQAIVEIDKRPALDVYDEWLGGEIRRLSKEVGKSDVIRDLLVLHPIYRKYTLSDGKTYTLFSHPWPKDDTLKDRSVMTSTKIKAGERIYLSRGTWGTLMNRIGNLPRIAKSEGGIDASIRPIFGIGYICAGVLGTIPETEREKLPSLINYANNNAPFIANFTWGEQGYFRGIGNKHGNLLSSFLLVTDKR
ncbi:MAG: hypothetical protein FJ123_13285 [Deltaproteobacteria bacterium]|nr:hypothetical protein [Deltaproteobacteria bacterium]